MYAQHGSKGVGQAAMLRGEHVVAAVAVVLVVLWDLPA